MQRIRADGDGTLFGFTKLNDRTYKSMNYHRKQIKRGKNLWGDGVPVAEEPLLFDTSDERLWHCDQGNYWWISRDGDRVVGVLGERVAFFPHCGNHPGPWHGYPVSPMDDDNYEIPEEVIQIWEKEFVNENEDFIDDLVLDRIRRGKI